MLVEPPALEEVVALYMEAFDWMQERAPAEPKPRTRAAAAGAVFGAATHPTWHVPSFETDARTLLRIVQDRGEERDWTEALDPGEVAESCLDEVLRHDDLSWGRVERPFGRARCRRYSHFAGAWARSRAGGARLGDVPNMKPVAYAAVLAVLAATSVVAYLVWRSSKERKNIRSKHYKRVAELRGSSGPVDEGVALLLGDADTHDRASWTLEAAHERLGDEVFQEGGVRAALMELTRQVGRIVAEIGDGPGDPFESSWMVDVSGVRWDELKVVREVEESGFITDPGDKVVVPSRVRCSTADWEALSADSSKVGAFVREHIDELVSDSDELCWAWRAEDGLRSASLLYDAFEDDLDALAAWRDDLARRLDEAYAESTERTAPTIGPQVGDLYQQAQMRLEEGAVGERSVVTEVVFPGLYTTSGYAIVEAVVRVEPAGEGEHHE